MNMRVSRLASAVVSIVALAATASACGGGDPPPPQGAYFARLSSSGSNCNNTGVAGHLGTVTTTKKTTLVTNLGAEQASVSCSVVQGAGANTFDVSASLTLNSDFLGISIPKIDASATRETPAVGSVGFSSSGTSNISYQSSKTGCNFFFIPGSGESVGL